MHIYISRYILVQSSDRSKSENAGHERLAMPNNHTHPRKNPWQPERAMERERERELEKK
jgi:hypothetical protein